MFSINFLIHISSLLHYDLGVDICICSHTAAFLTLNMFHNGNLLEFEAARWISGWVLDAL